MKPETELLLRYLDGELSADEQAAFRSRLAESPELRARLSELRRVGALVRLWANDAQARAGDLLEPTLRRAQEAEKRRARHSNLAFALAALLVVALPWASRPQGAFLPANSVVVAPGAGPAPAAIERIESGDKQAQVFVVGGGRTPVVWLADEAGEEDAASADQDPG